MKITFLEHSLEPIFWKYVNRNLPHFYFLAFDWKYNRDKTEIMLALEGKSIKGMMLIYRQYIVQLRGNKEAVKALLEKLNLEKVELQAPRQHNLAS